MSKRHRIDVGDSHSKRNSFSQACGHIGAVLFVVADWFTAALKTIPGEVACTDVLCEWIKPKGTAVKPKLFADIGQEQPSSKRRRTTNDYGKFLKDQTRTSSLPTQQQVLTLRENLLAATSHLGWIPPAVWSLDASRFRSSKEVLVQPPLLPHLPDELPELSPHLAFSSEMTVTTKPLPIAFLPHETFPDATHASFNSEVRRFIEAFPYTPADLEEVTRLTLGQSTNLEWFHQRYGSLTSSSFGRIIRYVATRKADPDNIIRDLMGYKNRDNPTKMPTAPSLKYGQRYERIARTRYISRCQSEHLGIRVEETGLHVHPRLPFLRASPDGIVHCPCHPDRLLEIKCPYSSREKSVRQAVREKTIPYLSLEPDFKLTLKKDTDYYSQVQGAMAVTGIAQCDFVVYTKKTMEIIPIDFDAGNWISTEQLLCDFFEVYMVPEVLTERIANQSQTKTLAPMDIPSVTPAEVVRCDICATFLPEADDICDDNSNAAVACDCSKCGCVDKWYCWPCVGFTTAMASAGDNWYCRSCQIKCS